MVALHYAIRCSSDDTRYRDDRCHRTSLCLGELRFSNDRGTNGTGQLFGHAAAPRCRLVLGHAAQGPSRLCKDLKRKHVLPGVWAWGRYHFDVAETNIMRFKSDVDRTELADCRF